MSDVHGDFNNIDFDSVLYDLLRADIAGNSISYLHMSKALAFA